MLVNRSHQVVGFQRQTTGIEAEDLDGQPRFDDQIGEYHVFRGQAGGQPHRTEAGADVL